MTAEHQPDKTPLFAAFLDDFYAECDEHLTAIRQALLSIEPRLSAVSLDRGVLDELFRSFHSLKGLAGMASLSAAEQLAHELEAILRQLREGQQPLTTVTFDALLLGTGALDQVIAAHRAQAPTPEVAPTLARLAALAAVAFPAANNPAPGHAQGLTPQEQEQIDAATQRSESVWSMAFTPSPTLAERGVNVNAVRAHLQSLGVLVRVTPRVSSTGGIAFDFILAANLDEAALAQLVADGIEVAPYRPTQPAPELAPAPPLAPPPLAPSSLAPSQVVRVDLQRLDELLQLVGELMITRARLSAQLEQIEPLLPRAEWRAIQETGQTFGRRLRDLRAGVVRVRMVPVGELFARMQFAIRDVARDLGRQVAVELRGQETEIDKFLVERMFDPLMHLIRNAASHGLEHHEERLAAGKPAIGTIALRAAAAGDSVVIEIEDDGRGIDAGAVAARARELGLLAGDAPPGSDALLDLLCAPGLSTRAQADRVSGRGVGLDVVRTAIRELNGALALRTAPGRGSTFQMTLPLTLLVVDALLASVGGQIFAIPLSRVREVVEIEPERVTSLDGHELTLHRGKALPLLRLARRFTLEEAPGGGRFAFVVGDGEPVGLVVDRLLGKREIVVRPIHDSLGRAPGIGGATELGDGRPVLILDVPGLLARAG